MKKCPNCGASGNDNDKFCRSCGTDLSGVKTQEQVLPEVKPVVIDPVESDPSITYPVATPAKPVSSQAKEKISITCLLGFIFSVILILSSVAYWIFQLGTYTKRFPNDADVPFAAIAFLCIPVGFLLSMIGTITTVVNKSKSKRFGIAGLCITIAGSIGGIVMWVLFLNGTLDAFKKYDAKEIYINNYEVRLQRDDPSLASAEKYFWNGYPSNLVIEPGELRDGTKITSIGETEGFRVVVENTFDYYSTDDYRNAVMPYFDHKRNPYKNIEGYGIRPGTELHFSNVIFEVKIGKDIEKVSIRTYSDDDPSRYLAVKRNVGSTIIFYKYFYSFTVDPENKNYYAENGILYDKKTNEEVDAHYFTYGTAFDEMSYIYEPEQVPTEYTETTETHKRTMTFGTGSELINLWSFTDEVPKMVGQYIKQNPEFGRKYTVECTIINTAGGMYQEALDNALAAGGDNAPDIYVAEQAFIIKYTKGSMSKFAATYNDLGINVKAKVKEADIAQYTVDVGSRNGEIIALGYQSTGCVMIYNAEIAKDVFGTDDPSEIENITGAGSGKWDKFLAAADKLEAKGYAAVSGCGELWNACDKSATTPWVVDGELKVDPKREEYFDLAKTIKEKGYSNNTRSWSEGWYSDMKGEGEKKVFAFFGPAWLINYVMIGNSGGNQPGEGTYGQWRVCAPPVGSFWGGSWLFANKDTDNKEGVAELLEWITLDTSETGLQYLWANGLVDWDNDPETMSTKDTVASNAVMAKSDGSMDFCGGQNTYAAFIQGNNFASGKCMTEYDESISGYFTDMAEHYAAGEIDKKQALKDFIEVVKEYICF